MTTREFIELLIPKLNNIPVLKSLCISQICLESQFGKKHFYNNYLGIKCHNVNAYAGCRLGKTSEVINGEYQHNLKLAFQTYNNIDECIEDYSRIMTYVNPKNGFDRYKPVREATDYITATEQVRACGYATSLTYVQSLQRIIEKYKLYELDYIMDKDTNLTQHFRWSEFFCNGIEPPEKYLDNIKAVATELEKLRSILGKPIRVNSGWRTSQYNTLIGGSKNSKHLQGLAADIHINIKPVDIAIYAARYTNFKGFGIGLTYNHLDLRDKLTIWHY